LCDEAHILRNYDSKKYLALDTLKATNKWLLTGTPVVNHIRDLGSLIHLIHKKVSPKLATVEKGHGWMQKFALQRTVQQVRDALPDIMPREPLVFHHRLDFETDEEATFYRTIQGAIVQNLQQMIDNDHIDIYVFLELILRLRQISTHPQVYIQSRRRKIGGYRRPDWTGTSTKTNGILNILRSEKQHHGYVIFCHFNDEMELLKKILEKEGSVGKVFIYNGSLSPEQRTNVIQDTKNHINSLDVINGGYILDEFPHLRQLPGDILNYVIQPFLGPQHTVLLAQIQTAGTGLNLQHMDRVIFTSSWWTAALMDQAVSRVVRIGQTKDVHVHHVILNEEDNLSINIDDYIHERVEMKRELCNELLLSANHTM
jgi:SNF2 family DNA or RNA helicase